MKTRIAALTLAALIMWRIKRYYADASVDDLRWILDPTARLVTVFTSAPFHWQPGEGYLSRERLFLIEKACAGINFMIAAFGTVAFVLRRRMCGALTSAAVIAASLAASYAAAVIVNAARIVAALWLAVHAVHPPGVNPAQFHRIEGIVFYFGGLVALHASVQRFDEPSRSLRFGPPLAAYYALTLAVPFANGAWRNGAAFMGYAVVVVALPLIVVALIETARCAIAAAPVRTPDGCASTTASIASGLCQREPADLMVPMPATTLPGHPIVKSIVSVTGTFDARRNMDAHGTLVR